MSRPSSLLLDILLDPRVADGWAPSQWDLVVRQARRSGLLARLAETMEGSGMVLPDEVAKHLLWGKRAAHHQADVIRWEVDRILLALSRLNIPVMLLKGAAYLVADLPAARGRLFSDVDILVPWEALQEVEQALFLAGYVSNHPDPYDQRYYRKWMHELPPLQHVTRKTLLDVHHNIVPDTARMPVEAQRLWEDSQVLSLPKEQTHGVEVRVLQPVDLVLHSAVHLFNEGEFEHGLRDLLDMDSLVTHFSSQDPGFMKALDARAQELALMEPLGLALRYRNRLLSRENGICSSCSKSNSSYFFSTFVYSSSSS